MPDLAVAVFLAILSLGPCKREPLDAPRLALISQAIATVSANTDEAAALVTIGWHESNFCRDVHDGTRRGYPSGQGLWQIEAGSHRVPPFYGLSYEATEHAAGQALWLWRASAICGDARKRFGLYAGLGCRSWSGAIPRANLYWYLSQKVLHS